MLQAGSQLCKWQRYKLLLKPNLRDWKRSSGQPSLTALNQPGNLACAACALLRKLDNAKLITYNDVNKAGSPTRQQVP